MMNPRAIAALTAAAALGAILAGTPALPGQQTYTSAAAIRMDNPATGYLPTVHRNGSHPAPGVSHVTVERGHERHGQTPGVMRVHFTDARNVVHVAVEPDESMVLTGITCGISGGVQHANVYCQKDGRYLDFLDPADRALMGGPSANWWISVTHTGNPR